MTAALLTEGTTTRNTLELAGELSEIGASIDADGDLESSSLSLTTLTKHTERALDLYTDVLLHPAFPEKELKRLQIQRLAILSPARRRRGDRRRRLPAPPLRAGASLRPPRPRHAEVGQGADPRRRGRLPPAALPAQQRRLIVVGDTTPDAITAALEEALKGWKPGEAPGAAPPEPPQARR